MNTNSINDNDTARFVWNQPNLKKGFSLSVWVCDFNQIAACPRFMMTINVKTFDI